MRKKMGLAGLLAAFAALVLPAVASAATVAEVAGTLEEKASSWTWSGSRSPAVLVFLMQAGFMFLEIGFSRQKNAGTGVAKILVNFAIVTVAWWAIGYGDRRRRRQRLLRHQRVLLPLRPDGRPGGRSVQRRRLRRDADALRARLLRGLAGDRLGHDPGADQVRRLRDLRDRLRRGGLPAGRARGLGRRPALRHRRQAGDGLRRLLGGPPHRCGRRAGGAAAARPAQRQVRRQRQAAGDPRALDAAGRPRRDHPLDRLVRVQRRLDLRNRRLVLRRGDAEHPARRRRRCDRRLPRRLPEEPDARRRHGRQRRDRRPRRHHRPVRASSSTGRRRSSASSPA